MSENQNSKAVETTASFLNDLMNQALDQLEKEGASFPFGLPVGISAIDSEKIDFADPKTKSAYEEIEKIFHIMTQYDESAKLMSNSDDLADEENKRKLFKELQKRYEEERLAKQETYTSYDRTFYSNNALETGPKKLRMVGVLKNDKGKTEYSISHLDVFSHRLILLLNSYNMNESVHLAEAELKAQEKLKSMLTPEQLNYLVLNDAFWVEGQSGMRYLLRRQRPTIAMRMTKETKKEKSTIRDHQFVASLCIHPMGFYHNTFIGALVPSDELIFILNLINAGLKGEYKLWKLANAHAIHEPQSGI